MKALYAALGLMIVACGGSTDKDLTSAGGSAGSSGSSGSGGSGALGGSGGSGAVSGSGGSGAVSGSGGSGAVGGSGGQSGSGGFGGGPACCKSSQDCPSYAFGPPPQCVNGVCKQPAPPGQCWTDKDCAAGVQGKCIGASVCPCGADCDGPDTPGKCVTVGPGCCAKDADCPSSSTGKQVCISGNCEPAPSPGKCWSDKDCPPGGGGCVGECICPCGAICACGGQMGTCAPPPPGPVCCVADIECIGIGVCAGGVCKAPVSGGCWKDADCGPNATCEGESICPCGALCALADYPGKCKKKN